MSEIGNLLVRVNADTAGLEEGLGRATDRIQSLQRSIAPMVKTMGAVGAAATAAAVGVAAFTKSGMNAIDAQAKLARQLDSTIGGLRGLQLASEDAGVATGVINSAMERFSARLGEAQRGTGQAKDALDRLGLSARALAGMDVDERMAAIADRVQQLGLSGAETADILRQFGIRNREIVNLLRQGGDAIRDARQEIEDYGLAVDAVDAGAIEAANDALSRVGLVTESVRNALAVELAPVVLEIATRFNDAAREAGGMGDYISNAVQMSVQSIAGLLDKLQQIRIFNQQVVVATRDMELAFARFAQNTWNAVSPLFDNMTRQINFILNGLSKIPGMGDIGQMELFSEGDFMERINNRLEQALGSRNLAQLDLNELMDADLPSERIDEFFDRINDRREKLKARLEQDRIGSKITEGFEVFGMWTGGSSGGGESEEGGSAQGGDQSGSNANERLKEQMDERLEIIRRSVMSEKELETAAYLDKAEELNELRESGAVTEEEHRQLLRDLAMQHQKRLTEIDARGRETRTEAGIEAHEMTLERLREQYENEEILKQEFYDRALELEQNQWAKIQATRSRALSSLAQMVGDSYGEQAGLAGEALAQIVSVTATQSKKAFKIQKAAAIASAIVNTYQGVSKSLSAYPMPFAGVMAAAHLATGMAQVQKIRSQSFGGGGGGGGSVSSGAGAGSASGAGTGGGQPAQPAAPSGGTLTVEGISSSSLFTGDAVRELAQELIDYQRRGGVVVLE